MVDGISSPGAAAARRHPGAGTRGSGQGWSVGSVLGGRFEIEGAAHEDPLGTVLRARDQKTGRPIAVRLLAPGLIATDDALARLRDEVKSAASVQHKFLAATYGMGNVSGGPTRFVASEWIDGETLTAKIEAAGARSEQMSLRMIGAAVSHVCSALAAASEAGAVHGALRPNVVWVTKKGRVKVTNLGVDRAILASAGPAALGAVEQAFLAPEVKAGASPDARADVFGVGGLLYAMLTGRTSTEDFVPPSQAHAEATAEIDALLLKCLAADPATRFADVTEVGRAVAEATGAPPPSIAPGPNNDLGLDIEVDLSSRPPPPGVGGAPRVGARVPINHSFRPPAVPSDLDPFGGSPPVRPDGPVMSAEVDLGNLLSKITENDAPRWMVVKDNLDHGPFSGRELVNLILKGEVLGEHGLLNMDSGERRKVIEAPEFVEFVQQWKIKKAESDHLVALETSAKVETRFNVTKVAIMAAVFVAACVGVAIVLVTTEGDDEEEVVAGETGDLFQGGNIAIEGTAGILPDPPRRTGRRSGRRGARRGGAMSYEEAMNQVADLGSATGTGSQARLSPAQVAGVMNQNIGRVVPCLRQGAPGGPIRIDMAIAGSGRVQGASVHSGSPAFQSCVASRVRSIRFPSFAAPRMGASYTFSAN